MGRDTIQLEGAISTIFGEYLLEFTSEYGIPENLHPEVPGLWEIIMDFPEGKVAHEIPPVETATTTEVVQEAVHEEEVAATEPPVNKRRKQMRRKRVNKEAEANAPPKVPLCLVGLSQNYYLGDDVYPTFLYDDDQEMDLFILIRNPNPFKIKTGMRPRATHEGHLPTVESSPLTIDNKTLSPSLLEGLAHEIPPVETATTTEVVQEAVHEEEVAATEPPVNKRRKQMRRKRVNKEAEANAPPKVMRKDHASGLAHSTLGGKSLAAMGLDAGTTFSPPATQNTPTAVSDPEPLSYAKPQPYPVQDITQSSKGAVAEILTEDVSTTEVNVHLSMGSSNSGKSISPSVGGSPGGIYQPGWGMTNNCRLDSPEACQDMVDQIVPLWYFSELRHLHNTEFLSQYNMNLARKVALGSQLRLRFEQEVRLLKKATTKIAKRDQKIQAWEEELRET
ncbi:hypothetical protein Tco_0748336 [Tanacetum coccineum]|uniref:Uncharacterized protein n=1 Tax=Tanacetum coccineum TaxID=301880 RepID=A0ABQ4YVJ2_9ASTR